MAGSAGGKVRSAARLLAQAAILSGLYAAQRDDYPITVKTGHSVSELILSPEPIDELPGGAAVEVLDFASSAGRFARTETALAALAAVVARLGLIPLAALEEAARRSGKAYAEKNLAAVPPGRGSAVAAPGARRRPTRTRTRLRRTRFMAVPVLSTPRTAIPSTPEWHLSSPDVSAASP